MGVKRPFEEEEFSGPSYKHKHIDYHKSPTSNTEEFPYGEAKSIISMSPYNEELEDDDTYGDKELELSVPLSLVTSCSSEEEVGNGDSSFWSNLPGDIDFSEPRRPTGNRYISLMNSPPRKVVPLGPDHQAKIPKWDPHATRNESEQKRLMGTCIIPMRDQNYSAIDVMRVGRGRTDCRCMDVGSMRCVQQHVKEAREKLQETLGDEIFTRLGFYNMGIEVACNWTPYGEKLFHEVVFSNPMSLGRNFWKHLRVAFPNRTNKDIVSYYFNVFMLRRRAVQNRSYSLEIDSDDDEEEEKKGAQVDFYQSESHLSYLDTGNDDDQRGQIQDSYIVEAEEDENSMVDSLGDGELDSSWMDNFWCDLPANGNNGINDIFDDDIGKKQGCVDKLDGDPSVGF